MDARFIAARSLASLLAMGAMLWGFGLGLYLIVTGFPLIALLTFGPGYVVTAGYLIRTLSISTRGWRILIWSLSVLVQGGWLTNHVVESLNNGGSIACLAEPTLAVRWWLFATIASVVGLILDWAPDPSADWSFT